MGGAQGQKLAVGAVLAPAFHHSPQGPGVNLAWGPHTSRLCVKKQRLCDLSVLASGAAASSTVRH